jgi:hypothetical protein
MSSLRASFRSFFIYGFRLRVGLGDQGSGFTPPKTQMMKKPLALADADVDLVAGLQMMTQESAVPKRLGISQNLRIPTEILADGLEDIFRKSRWAARPFSLFEAGEAALLEVTDPILDGSRAVPQESRNLVRTHAGAGEKDAVEPMVIAGLFRPLNFVLDGDPDDIRIRDLQTTHDVLLSESIIS